MKHLFMIAIFCATLLSQKDMIRESFEGIKRIEIELGSGSGTITKSESKTVFVETDYEFKNEEDKPLIEKRGSKLYIRERRKRNRNMFFGSRSSRAEWELRIPDGISLEFSTGSGNVKSNGVAYTEVEINTGSGTIKLEDNAGEAYINTGSGRISVKKHKGDIRSNTGSGGILYTNVHGRLQGNTGSGDIQVEQSSGGFKLNTGSGDIELSETDVLKRTSLNTGSGDVVLRVDKAVNADLSMNAGSGDILLDYNGAEIKGYIEMTAKRESRIRAPFEFDRTETIKQWGGSYVVKSVTLGEDEPEISLSTGSGRVTIKK